MQKSARRTSRSRSPRSPSPGSKPRASKSQIWDLGPPDRCLQFIADNSILKAQSPGLNFRATKEMKDKIRPYRYFKWDENGSGEHIRGIDEGDGWVRTERGFLPIEVLGNRVLKPLVQAPASPDGTKDIKLFEKMFELMIRLCGGPGQTAQKLVGLIEEEFELEKLTRVNIQDMRTAAESADTPTESTDAPVISEDAVETGLELLHECAHLICVCVMERLGRGEEFIAVVHRVLRCVVQVCLQLPPPLNKRCSRPLIDLLLHKSVVLESTMQLWKLLTDAQEMKPEWVYGAGVLAADFHDSLELLLSENTDEEEVEFELKAMKECMRTIIQSVRFHLAWVEKAGLMPQGEALPFYAKLAMQSAVQEGESEKGHALSGFSSDTPGVSRMVEGSYKRHVESLLQVGLQEGASSKRAERDSGASGSGLRKKGVAPGSGLRKKGIPRKTGSALNQAMVQKYCKMREDADNQLSSARLEDEDFESQESEEIDSKSSEADDDDIGLDLAGFIDCDPEMNCHGFINLEELPRPSSQGPPSSTSPLGLRAFIEQVREMGGVDETNRHLMEAFLKLDPVQDWHEQVRNIFKTRSNCLSTAPVPKRPPPEVTETSS